jgi:uncharacterized protein YggE
MRKSWLLAAGLALMLAMVGLTGCGQSGAASLGDITGLNLSSQQQGIWVTGEGKVTAVPDIATLGVGIEAEEASVAEAQAQASDAMDKVMTALTENGVAEKDIQTQYFSIQNVTKWDEVTGEQVTTGYRVTNMVTAKIRDIDKAGTIIDAVAEAGGDLTRINSIDFSVDDPSPYYGDARKEAVADAKAKAIQLAGLADVTLGEPTYISESYYSPPVVSRAVYAMEAAAAETPISPGEMEISISVQVAYAIK